MFLGQPAKIKLQEIFIFSTIHSWYDHRTPSIRAIEQVQRKKDKEINNKLHRKEGVQSKSLCPLHKFFYIFSLKLKLSFLVSLEALIILSEQQKEHTMKEPTIVSEIAIKYLHTNIIFPLLCQCALFIHT